MNEPRRVVSPVPRVMESADAAWILGPAGEVALVEGDAAGVVRAVLDAAAEETTREAIVAEVLAQAGATADQRAVVDEALSLLERLGAIGTPRPAPAPARAAGPRGRVLVAVTGAVGTLGTPALVMALLAAGHEVRVAMTREARRFVGRRAFEAITHRAVATSLWRGTPEAPAPHVELARWADVVVVDPCSATTLARIAAGDCSELVAAVATTTRAPVLLVPSMNPDMLASAAVQENLEAVRAQGKHVARPGPAIELADAPAERALTGGGAAPAPHVVRFVEVLLARALRAAPQLPSAAEWDDEHAKDRSQGDDADAELCAALAEQVPPAARVLDVGAGTGAFARAAAAMGHAVVATDVSPRAIERAAAVDASLPVTWLVDDATASRLHGTFDAVIDRGCLGVIPEARRERYVAQVAAWLREGGLWLVKTHRAAPAGIRAYGFEPEEVTRLAGPRFDVVSTSPSALRFGAAGERPSWTVVLRRRGPVG